MSLPRTFALYKPFGVLSQFRDEDGHPGLGSLSLGLPKNVWPVGRLDRDSEGLLLLTSDMALRHNLMDPAAGHRRMYWAQVEGEATESMLDPMRAPMTLRIKKKEVRTRPTNCRVLAASPNLPERIPPIRFRQSIPTSWLELSLTEGKNRQVRRMTAAVGLPTLRLVRAGVGDLRLESLNLAPGTCVELERADITKAQA